MVGKVTDLSGNPEPFHGLRRPFRYIFGDPASELPAVAAMGWIPGVGMCFDGNGLFMGEFLILLSF